MDHDPRRSSQAEDISLAEIKSRKLELRKTTVAGICETEYETRKETHRGSSRNLQRSHIEFIAEY